MKDSPVYGAFTPSQLRALRAPINGHVCGVRDGHVFVGGATIVDHLNKIFDFRWSSEIISETFVGPTKNQAGKFSLTVHTRVRLTVHTPGGLEITHDGTGASEGVAGRSTKTLYQNVPKQAETFALRDAAMKLGDQFGMRVMRLKDRDDNGRPIDWQAHAAPHDPEWPDLVSSFFDGQVSMGKHADLPPPPVGDDDGESDVDERGDTSSAGNAGRLHPNEARNVSQNQGNEDRNAGQNQGTDKRVVQSQPQGGGDSGAAQDGAQGGAKGSAGADDEARRAELVAKCRNAWRDAGNAAGAAILAEVSEAAGKPGMRPHQLPHPVEKGGAPISMLEELLSKLIAAKG